MGTKERIYLITFLFSFCTFLISPSVFILLQDDTDVAYFFNISEEEENKEESMEKDMDENFICHFQVIEWAYNSSEAGVFFHLQPVCHDVFRAPVLPPPEFRV
ncbi:hypothetical protein [Robertkochia flava]|uniref:hypothetical protein n=1 Tax=Robertkochia flava TaxID=3447986 RepID=UPI001CCF5CF0|nr:hypothetical protein [Robertkochia marina]